MNTNMSINITLPDGWHEVTIGQYMELIAIDTDNQTRKIVETISILTDTDDAHICKMDLPSLKKISEHIMWLGVLPKEASYKPIIRIGEEEFGFVNRLTDLTLGEWIDMDEMVKDFDKNIHKMIALLYRPLVTAFNDRDRIVESYDPASLDARAELFKNSVNMQDVYGVLVFFCLIVRTSTETIVDYLTAESMTTMISGESKRLNLVTRIRKLKSKVANGLGTIMLTRWHREMLQKWKQYLRLTSY